ncbi:Metallo-hydrolase/oxidoreductase, partial [Trematosphaeria pertusa]
GNKRPRRHTLLFDTGPSHAAWIHNACALGVRLTKIDLVVLSHWCRNHAGGIKRVSERIARGYGWPAPVALPPALIMDVPARCPRPRGKRTPPDTPASFQPTPTIPDFINGGRGARADRHDDDHLVMSQCFMVSGEIPRNVDYEGRPEDTMQVIQEDGRFTKRPDWIQEERFVACIVKGKGLVVFAPCSHAGIVNTVEHAMTATGLSSVYAIAGGFHLRDASYLIVDQTIKRLKGYGVEIVIAGHCTGKHAIDRLQDEFGDRLWQSFVGAEFTI